MGSKESEDRFHKCFHTKGKKMDKTWYKLTLYVRFQKG